MVRVGSVKRPGLAADMTGGGDDATFVAVLAEVVTVTVPIVEVGVEYFFFRVRWSM